MPGLAFGRNLTRERSVESVDFEDTMGHHKAFGTFLVGESGRVSSLQGSLFRSQGRTWDTAIAIRLEAIASRLEANRNKDAARAPGLTTRSKDDTRNKGHRYEQSKEALGGSWPYY